MIDYELMLENIIDAIKGDDEIDFEIAVAIFPKEETIMVDESFPAAIKTTASPGLTGQVFISYLQTNPPEAEEVPAIWIPDQELRH